jgi:hypothetical protein
MSTIKHDQFQHILQLLMLATTINYGHAMLPDTTYKSKFNDLEDQKWNTLSHRGVLNALAVIFVRGPEVFATTDIQTVNDLSPRLLTTYQDDPSISSVLVAQNPQEEDQNLLFANHDGQFKVIIPAEPFPLEEAIRDLTQWERLIRIM